MSRLNHISKLERKEPMFVTWSRILTSVREYNNDKRLLELVEKFNKDLKTAKIEENYFKGVPEGQIDALSTESTN